MTGWRKERGLLLLLLAAGISGIWWSPLPFLPLAIVSTVALLWHLRQALRFRHWLTAYERIDAPEMRGIWYEMVRLALRPTKRSQRYRHRLLAITDRLQDSTSALQEAVIMVDRHGNLEWWNSAASECLGLRDPVDIDQPITNLIRAPDFGNYLSAGNFDNPLQMPSPVNRDQWLEIKVTPFGRNDQLMIVHDVSRIRQLEEMRKDFVANVSHELRTPLTVIRGYLETMEQLTEGLPERTGRMLTQMQEQAGRMDSLVRDLLILSRLENHSHEHADEVDVITLLEQITEEAIAVSSGRHKVTLTLESEASLQGYENELRSAFTNLIINAVKYTPEGGQVNVRWYEDGAQLCLSVTDTGVGIEEHHIPRLTERFYRADPSRSKNTGGTGLGLAIVKHVLLRHHGKLVITSEYSKGSCFTACFRAADHIQQARTDTSETA